MLLAVLFWADQAQGEIRTEGSICPNCATQTKRVRCRKPAPDPVSCSGNPGYPSELRALWLERALRATHMER